MSKFLCQKIWLRRNLNCLRKNWGCNFFIRRKTISIELPKNIECVIESTDAVVKGQTAASSYKPAKLNGITITVPPFIESGDKIIIDSRSLEYVKKIT